MRKFSNNQVFGSLKIISAYYEITKYKHWKHLCLCSCGSKTIQAGVHLSTGAVISCGCIKNSKTSARLKTHGWTGTRTYNIWKGIKKRCYNVKDHAYSRYGGAGILMCDEWKSSFESFLSDMGDCPEGLTIDRINGSDGYHKDNCRWATYTAQARNRRQLTDMPTGVSKLPSGRYRALICVNYKTSHIGVFDTIEEAAKARKDAEGEDWQNGRL